MKKMFCFFFDLDGTLINIKDRVYQAHKYACNDIMVSPLQKDIYWQLKRQHIPEEKIVNLPLNIFKKYNSFRINNLEDENLLKLDRIFPQIQETLEILHNENNILFLVTMRKYKKRTLDELKRLNLYKYFTKILISSNTTGTQSEKLKSIQSQNKIFNHYKTKFIIGDTEIDIKIGKELAFKTVGIKNGIRNVDILRKAKPDYLLESVKDLPEIL